MENYYSILGVSINATKDEIKKAYLQLARQYHPDRFFSEEEKQVAHERFSIVTAAYRTLSDEKLKTSYDQSLEKRTTASDEAKKVQAKNIFTRALNHLNQGQHWQAANLLHTAYGYHAHPIYLSYWGLAQVYTKKQKNEGFEKIKQAIKQSMYNALLHVNLGLAYEFIGDKTEALKAYQEALNWNPNNEKAKQGIERVRERKKGLFVNFFGGAK